MMMMSKRVFVCPLIAPIMSHVCTQRFIHACGGKETGAAYLSELEI
jgi:hypothetical protein